MLARRPEGVDLVRELGLPLVHPATTSSSVWTSGALRPLPRSVMGVPADVEQVAASGVLSAAGVERLRHETPGRVPRRRRGRVGRRAGRDPARRRGRRPAGRATARRRVRRPRAAALRPRDRAAAGGLEQRGVAGRRRGAGRLGHARPGVRRHRGRSGPAAGRAGRGSRGPHRRAGARAPAHRRPASRSSSGRPSRPRRCWPTRSCWPPRRHRRARLLADALARWRPPSWPGSSTRRWPSSRWPSAPRTCRPCPGSGFLVPPVDGRTIKAATFSFAKWDWVREAGDGLLVLRTSVGRHREESVLQVPDEDLVAASLADLAEATGLAARPVDSHVQRWGGGLPQYAVGHVGPGGADPGGRGRRARAGRLRGGVRRRRHPRRDRLGPPGGRDARAGRMEAHERDQAERRPHPRDQRHHPLHDVVGVPARDAVGVGRAARDGEAAEVDRPARQAGSRRRGRARGLRAERAARRRRRDGLVARRDRRAAPGRLPAVPPHRVRAAARAGLVAGGAAPAGGVQQEPRAGVPGRRGAARATCASTRSCGPTTGTSSTRPSAARCSPSTARWRAATPTSAPTPSPASRSATTSGSSPSRPTSCTASST